MADTLFHIFALLISLGGQPLGVLESKTTFPDKVACEAVMPQVLRELQAKFDNSTDPDVRGKVAVAGAICDMEDADGNPASLTGNGA